MLRFFERLLLLTIICAVTLNAQDKPSSVDTSKLSAEELTALKTDFCSLAHLNEFYDAEYTLLQNSDDARVQKMMSEIAEKHDEPLVRERASRILDLLKSEYFEELCTKDFSASYFSSDSRRRISAVQILWEQNSEEAGRYIFYLVENDKSYDVKIKAMQALATFTLPADILSSFIISTESTDENLAVASIYVLLQNEPEQTVQILLRWIDDPKYPWQQTNAARILESVPEMLETETICNLLNSQFQSDCFDSFCEILTQKIQTSTDSELSTILKSLLSFIEQKNAKQSASWDKLWSIIVTKHDFTSYFKALENKIAVPKIVWQDVARRDSEYMLTLAFSTNIVFRNSARLALARVGLGLELFKKIKITEIRNAEYLTLNELIQQIRQTCRVEIYLSSYTEQIRDAEIKAFIGDCSLYELLALISKTMKLRYEFDNGRLLVFPDRISYRGFKLEPIFIDSSKTQEYFGSFVVDKKIESQSIHDLSKYLRDLTGYSIVVDSSKLSDDYKTPVIEKDKGLLAVLTRTLNVEKADLLVMANALIIMNKDECDLYKDAAKIIEKPESANFKKLIDNENVQKYQILSNVLQSEVGDAVTEDEYQKYVLEMLVSTKNDIHKATLIPCLGRLAQKESILDLLIEFMQSPVYVIRNSAVNTVKRSEINAHMLLSKFVNMNLNAQNVVMNTISQNLQTQDIVDYLIKVIESGNLKLIRMNFRTLSRLISNVYRGNAHQDKLDKRVAVNIKNEKLNWFLHLLKIQTRSSIHISPYLQKRLDQRPKLANTPLTLQVSTPNLKEILNLLSLRISLTAEFDELLPVINVYEMSGKESENSDEFMYFYPFEFDRLIAFQVLLQTASQIQPGFEKPVFEYIWNLTAYDELIETCKSESEIHFVAEYKKRLTELIERIESKRSTIYPEFARMFMRLRKMLKLEIPDLYKNYLDFPEDWFLPEVLQTQQKESDE